MKVCTVTLDFWGTLVLDSPSSDNRYQARRISGFEATLCREGFHFPAAQITRAYEDSGEYLRRVWSTGRDVPVREHVTAILRAIDPHLADQAEPDLVAALVEAYASPLLLVPPAVDMGARAALDGLRQAGITMAIVSNTMRTPGATLRTLLTRFGLLEYFEHIVFSDEVGVRKPEPEIFQAALRAVGAEPQGTVHVGDDAILDVRGARAAGLRTGQVVALGAGTPPASERPDRTITGLDELPAAIASLEAE